MLVDKSGELLHQGLGHCLDEGVLFGELIEHDLDDVVEQDVAGVGALDKVPSDFQDQEGRFHASQDVEHSLEADFAFGDCLGVGACLDETVLQTVDDLDVVGVRDQILNENLVEVEQMRLS